MSMSQSSHPPLIPLLCTPSRHFLKSLVLERDLETPHVQKNFSMCPKMLKRAAWRETGLVQSDLLLRNVDQTLLQETTHFSASSPTPNWFCASCFSVLDKESKSNMLSMDSCQKSRMAFKEITCFKFPILVQSYLPRRHCTMLMTC